MRDFPAGGTALVVVDVQNDFCPGGALAVAGGDEVLAPIASLMERYPTIVLTQDWHPAGHLSFASSWPGKAPLESVALDGMTQTLWPDHCVQGTEGADFHPGLDQRRAALIIRKGMNPRLDSYSGLFENDRRTPTGLEGWLRSRGIRRLVLVGLATDYCVRYTALDALALGFTVAVASDATRGVDFPPGSVQGALEDLAARGAVVAASAELGQ